MVQADLALDLETICKITLDILEKKHPCQQEDSGEEVELGAEQSEWDAHLIRGAGDLVSSLSLAVGPLFAPAFNSFLPALATYVDPKRQPGERSSSIGAIAESINGLKDGVTNFTETLFQLLLGSLADADLDVRSNSAFAMGSLVFQSRQDLSSQYLTILSRLEPLFDRKTDTDDSNQACDNACGAVARLILKNGAALPLAQVLPPWLASLPIRQDFAENVSGSVRPALTLMSSAGQGVRGAAGRAAQERCCWPRTDHSRPHWPGSATAAASERRREAAAGRDGGEDHGVPQATHFERSAGLRAAGLPGVTHGIDNTFWAYGYTPATILMHFHQELDCCKSLSIRNDERWLCPPADCEKAVLRRRRWLNSLQLSTGPCSLHLPKLQCALLLA
jgi:hypothetical protein